MTWIEELGQDVRYALRGLRSRPLLSGVAILCLSLGIATNTAVFSVYNAVILRPFPFSHPDQLVTIRERDPRTGRRGSPSYADYEAWRDGASSLSAVAAYSGRAMTLTEGTDPERVGGVLVSHDLFPMLGVSPSLGRLPGPDDDRPGAAPTALVSDRLWRRRWASDGAIVGRVISVDHEPVTVVGVMPPGFGFPEASDLWLPIAPVLGGEGRGARGVSVVGRLREGGVGEEASREVAVISRRSREALDPGGVAWEGYTTPLRRSFVGEDERIVTTALMGAVTFLLLIACANVANLLLTRAAGRRREIAVRVAIGAGRGRMLRQLLTEALVLGLASAAVAVPLAWKGLRLIEAAIPPSDPFPYYVHWSLDGATLLYTLGASLVTSLLFGLAPALHVLGGRLHESLKAGGDAAGSGRGGRRLRDGLVVAEMALALVMLVGASLFVKTFLGLSHVELGYDTSRLMTLRFYLPGQPYDSVAARNRVVEDVLRRVGSAPGVEAATVSDLIPLEDEGGSYGKAEIDGAPLERGREPSVFYAGVTGHWFRTFDIEARRGRTFSERELRDSVPVAVVNETMAAAFWPGDDAVGRRFRLVDDAPDTWFAVVGIVPDIRTVKLDEDQATPPTAYLPYRFVPTRDYALILRSQGAPAALAPAAREAIRAADATVPVFSVWTMDEVQWLSFWMYGLWGSLFGVFGGIALFLAAIGVGAVIFYSVASRTREMGVRMALGARPERVVAMVVREGLVLASTGIVLGLGGALLLTGFVSSLLIGVSPTDPVSFTVVAALLLLVAVAASLVPARRAAAVQPVVALRHE